MPSPAQIKRFRQRRRESAGRRPGVRLGLGCATLLSLFVLVLGIASTLTYLQLVRDLPSLETLPGLLDPPDGLLLEPTRLYDRTGSHVLLTLQNPAATDRQFLTLDTSQQNFLPASLISATLAVADPDFWQHSGYTLEGLASNDHPTLAQRLVSDLLLVDEPAGLRRNLRERLLAAQITQRYGREKILIWTLNSTDYGRLAFGADAAARVYLGKPAASLTLAESALLAAAMQTPALNPLDAPSLAVERSQMILERMQEGGWISAAQAGQAGGQKLALAAAVDQADNPAPAFLNLALEQAGAWVGLDRLERGGFRVVTSLDYDLQLQATCAQQAHLAGLEGQPRPGDGSGEEPCEAARLLPTTQAGNAVQLEGNLIILDHRSGEILALVGEVSPGLDPAHYPGHPAGSLWTPFIYLTGFTRGLGPASLLWDIPAGSQVSLNPDGKFLGPLRLRTALIHDAPLPALDVLEQVGGENVWRMARQLGLEGASFPSGESARSLLEDGRVTLLEITRAFGVFANQGVLAGSEVPSNSGTTRAPLDAVTLLSVEDAAGNVWLDQADAQARPVVSTQLAYLITHILSDEPSRWGSLGHPNPLEIGRPFAGKLGRTDDEQVAWAIGSTPYLTIGVRLGIQPGSVQGGVSALDTAALLHAMAQYASQDFPADGWPQPPGITTLAVCDPSGLLPTNECPAIVNEVFLTGTEPTQPDSLYRKLQINRETGLLATVFTPPELVEERVYLFLPPEAEEWQRLAGLPTPPETFDVILSGSATSGDARITSPSMFAYVHGKVEILGDAGGDGFQLYRLQVGQGLNPQQWLQVGEDSSSPVQGDVLGVWDTQDLEGLYALQLAVIRQDQSVQTDVVQITVDNRPPEAALIAPVVGQAYAPGEILLQAAIQDNLGIASVEFYIDDRLVSAMAGPPYTLVWEGGVGEHTARVRATDQAGNSHEDEVDFLIK